MSIHSLIILKHKIIIVSHTDPYPFAIDECFDAYRTLVASAGKIIGMSGSKLNVIFTGDSA